MIAIGFLLILAGTEYILPGDKATAYGVLGEGLSRGRSWVAASDFTRNEEQNNRA